MSPSNAPSAAPPPTVESCHRDPVEVRVGIQRVTAAWGKARVTRPRDFGVDLAEEARLACSQLLAEHAATGRHAGTRWVGVNYGLRRYLFTCVEE